MMDLVTLSGTAVAAAASPYLAKMVDGATEKIGEDALVAAGKVVDWLRAKLSPGGKEALDDLAKQPDDKVKQEILKLQIQKILRDNPRFVDELQALLPTISQTQTVSGDGAKVAQVGPNSNNNSISIG